MIALLVVTVVVHAKTGLPNTAVECNLDKCFTSASSVDLYILYSRTFLPSITQLCTLFTLGINVYLLMLFQHYTLDILCSFKISNYLLRVAFLSMRRYSITVHIMQYIKRFYHLECNTHLCYSFVWYICSFDFAI